MNILLAAVNAKYIHSNLAVYSLKASAGAYESLVELAEYTINHQTDDIFRSVYQKKPDLLFLSCYIWNRQVILETAANLRKVMPDTVIWAGGPEVSYDAAAFLQENPQFDGVMIGEGERTFHRILQYYVDNEGTLAEIPGIAYRKKETEITVQEQAAPMSSLDGLPFVYQNLEEFENRIIYYESSRGCPFSCSYCLSSIDKSVRFRSLELVKRELAFFLEHRVPQVKFVDRTFNCKRSHALEIWNFIREHDNGVTNFHFEIAADLLSEEELAVLARMRPGLVQLEIGVQTVNMQTLDAIHRMAKFEKIASCTAKIAQSRNIHQHLDLIAGLPYEDYESFKTSFDTVYRLHPQELQLGFLKVLRGSEMYHRAEEYGIIYRSEPPYEVLATKWISCDELLRLKEIEEMLEMYYNSQQFRCTIAALEKLFDRPFALYEALADYYKKELPQGGSQSRMQRFVFLRGFIRETLKVMRSRSTDGNPAAEQKMTADRNILAAEQELPAAEYFDELLTLDCYLRENAKSRPQWAEDQAVYKELAAGFYRREEQEHTCLPEDTNMTWKQLMRMTHLEHFTHDVLGSGEKRNVWLLFDYGRRDPLTYDAAVTEVAIV